jgi:polysaccharide biosynthesis protein PslG
MRERLVHRSFRMRASIAALAVVLVTTTAFAPAAQALPGKFWGVVPQRTPSPEQFQRLKRGGVDSIRISVPWGGVQPAKGAPLQWGGIDTLVGGAAAAGIEVLPFVYGAPGWAVPVDRSIVSHPPRYLPVRTAQQRVGWQAFLQGAVQRYGPRGSFWAENPAIPPRPIRNWQIWNEPNFKYFVSRPNPAEYGKLVKLSHTAIKAADGGAKIVLGGMFARPIEATVKGGPKQAYFATDFLDQMYARTPGVRSRFHGVALHPYTGAFQTLTPYIEDLRETLRVNRDAGKGLWLTELGWSSQKPRFGNSFAKGKAGQKQQLQGAFGLVQRNQRRWKVQRVYWFSVDDLKGACNFCDGSGLFSETFAPKPSWRAFVSFAGGRAA